MKQFLYEIDGKKCFVVPMEDNISFLETSINVNGVEYQILIASKDENAKVRLVETILQDFLVNIKEMYKDVF